MADRARRAGEQGTLPGPLATATYQGKLYAAPANSNTQLLWYRKDKVNKPADDVGRPDRAGDDSRRCIEIQGAQYEGVMVWFNSLVQSAGGTIVDGTTRSRSARRAGRGQRR